MAISGTARSLRHKPKKPSATFPLTPHANGQWCKKIRGKVHFFGVWGDPNAALANYLRVAADLHAGRQPRSSTLSGEAVTVKDVCNYYLTAQLRKTEAGEIGPRHFEDCRRNVTDFATFIGASRPGSDLRPEDFQRYRQKLLSSGVNRSGRGLGVHALNHVITTIKGVFRYAYEVDLLDHPMKYGQVFQKASATQIRKSRHSRDQEHGKRLFSPSEIQALLSIAGTPLKAMILLAINGGFGNTDCAGLPVTAVDFTRGVVEFARPKTGIERVVPLWPETQEALLEALAARPKPAEKGCRNLFLTVFGRPWVREKAHQKNGTIAKITYQDAVGEEFRKLLKKLSIKRRGIGFYTLRHSFRTWADEARDQHAVHRIMGHVIPGMSGIYVERIELNRLRAVVDHVRAKLFGQPTPESADPDDQAPLGRGGHEEDEALGEGDC